MIRHTGGPTFLDSNARPIIQKIELIASRSHRRKSGKNHAIAKPLMFAAGLLLALFLSACGTSTESPPPTGTEPVPPATATQAREATVATVATHTPVPAVATPVRPPATRTVSSDSAALSATINTIEDWRAVVYEIARGDPNQAQALADRVWQALVDTRRVPLVLGNQVVFLYKGQAESVVWRGVFTGWSESPGLQGGRVGRTDLWVAQTRFPTASRAEYKIVLNDEDWILDPANEATVASAKTVNNLLTMPGFTTSDESDLRPDVTPGELSGNLSIMSRSLGYRVNYRVYTPVGYDRLSKLPVLYVLDGSDFIDPNMGSLPNVLNNMLADGRIRPLIAVFVDPYEPGNPTNNRREKEFLAHAEEFARFIATEIVPAVDGVYRTDPVADARIIMGVSYGGLSSSFIAASYPQVFHRLVALSPSFWVLDNLDSLASQDLADGAAKMVEPINRAVICGGDTGIPCPALPLEMFLTYGVPEWDIGDLTPDVIELRSQGYHLQAIQLREGHAWSAWRGVLDEMLLFYLGK